MMSFKKIRRKLKNCHSVGRWLKWFRLKTKGESLKGGAE